MAAPQPAQPPFAPKGQSGLGIASMIVAIVGIGIIAVSLVAVAMLGAGIRPTDPRVGLLSFAMISGAAVNLVGIVLAGASFVDRERGHVASWVGLALNAAPCVLMGGATTVVALFGIASAH